MHSSIPFVPVFSAEAAGLTLSPQEEDKPHLISFDSSQEFSLEHLLHICKLVEREDRELRGYVFDDECLQVL